MRRPFARLVRPARPTHSVSLDTVAPHPVEPAAPRRMPALRASPSLPALLAGMLTLWLAVAGPAGAAAERGPRQPVGVTGSDPGDARVIVKYRSSGTAAVLSAGAGTTSAANVQRAASLSSRLGLRLTDGPAVGPRHQVIKASGLSSEALAARLASDTDVEYAVPSRRRQIHAVTPNDPRLSGGSSQSPAAGQWYLRVPDSTFVSSVAAPTAWAVSTGNAEIVVAVLDTGVRKDHPDLAGKLVAGYDFVSDSAIANDNDGRDDDPSDPGDWISLADTRSSTFTGCSESSSSWHGTQTAGLIAAATNNGLGMAGLGRNVRVQPVRVLGKCFGYDDDIIAGMRWAAGLTVAGVPANPTPAQVISLSLGSAGTCDAAYAEAVAEVLAAGVTVVASAGNDALAVNAPANCSGVIAVGGLRHIGTKNGYSSLGSAVTIAAPAGNCVNLTGECVYPISSTSNTGSTVPVSATYTSGGDDYAVGTSFSAPLVSATAALMRGVNPTLTPATLTSLIKTSARSFPTTGADVGVAACHQPTGTRTSDEQDECYCTTTTCGAGMLDAGAAVTAAAAGRRVANIVDDSSLLATGATGQFSAAWSRASTGNALTAYSWSLVSGSSGATLAAATGSITSLTAKGDATVLLRLTVTDAGGSSSTTSVVTTGAGGSDDEAVADSGGSGGGALDGSMLAGGALALGALLLAQRRRRR